MIKNRSHRKSQSFSKIKKIYEKDDNLSYLNQNSGFNRTKNPLPFKKIPKRKQIADYYSDQSSCDEKSTDLTSLLSKNTKIYPKNKDFDFNHEIKMYGPFDYLFEFRGEKQKKNEFNEKTKTIRKLPKHLKYSLFCSDKIKKQREKEFSFSLIYFKQFKKNGDILYKSRKYREALDNYIEAYSMLKWIEFKDPQKKHDLIKNGLVEPIIDDYIYFDQIKIGDVTNEQDSFIFNLIYLLLAMSYAFIELRHFQEAIDCLDECISYCGEKEPNAYFRRSQARVCNKRCDDQELLLALADIHKAKSLRNCQIYENFYNKLLWVFEEKRRIEVEKIEYIITQVKIQMNQKSISSIYLNQLTEIDYANKLKQYQVLKEMKKKYILAVKFYTETKNEDQLQIAYKEIDSFNDCYYLFKWYYKFQPKLIEKTIFSLLSEDTRILFLNEKLKNDIDLVKFYITEYIFNNNDFNQDLYKYASEKIGFSKKPQNEASTPAIDVKSLKQIGNFNYNYQLNINSKRSFACSILLMVISFGLIVLHYFWNSKKMILKMNIVS